MTKPRIRKLRTSRRAPGLQDSDYDHEITLVANDQEPNTSANIKNGDASLNKEPGSRGNSFESEAGPSERVPTAEPLVGKQSRNFRSSLLSSPSSSSSASSSSYLAPHRRSGVSDKSPVTKSPITESNTSAKGSKKPAIQVQQPTPFERPNTDVSQPERSGSPSAGNTEAIDILYENERGVLCCGFPLFASKALGNLDPPPWTNFAHKPSPTNIHTAQVPDPSWTWAWPEWRVNYDEGTDKDGWEYSFAFHRKFSWHGAKWWNSFVRRRAWIRRRVKEKVIRDANGGALLQPDYFTVRSTHDTAVAAAATQESSIPKLESQPSSKRDSIVSHASAASRTAAVATEIAIVGGVANLEIRDVDTLLAVLRVCRIDREKIEAVEKYLANEGDDDLERLDEKMHDIMAFFVFQASRRVLVARLAELRDRAAEESAKSGTGKDKEVGDNERHKVASLDAALKHADEEVRRLEYWSDMKGLAEKGQSRDAMNGECGWDHDSWKGVDNSGPAVPRDHVEK